MTLYRNNNREVPNDPVFTEKCIVTDETTFRAVTLFDHTFAKYEGNRRCGSNWIGSDCLFADFDNEDEKVKKDGKIEYIPFPEEQWVTIDKLKDAMKDYTFYLTTSKSHMKGKTRSDGTQELPARPKIHVYFPIKYTESSEKYKKYLELLRDAFPQFKFDAAVKDLARHFSATGSEAIVAMNEGEPITTLLDAVAERKKAEEEEKKAREKDTQKPKKAASNKGADKVAPFDESIFRGLRDNDGRHNKLMSAALSMQARGWEDDEMSRQLHYLNSLMAEPSPSSTVDATLQKAFDQPKGQKYIVISNTGPDDQPMIRCTEHMLLPTQHLICFNASSGQQKFLMEEDDAASIISSFTQLPAVMDKYNIHFAFSSKGVALTKSEYFEFIKRNARQIDRFALYPSMNRDDRTHTFYPPIVAKKTGAFREMLSYVTPKTLRDEYRLAAGLLSAFLGREFDGERPAIAVVSDSNSSGKTSAVQALTKMIAGASPVTFEGNDKDEQTLNGPLAYANPYALIDNMTGLSKQKMTDISRLVTDRKLKSWVFGVSHTEVPNNKTFFLTYNKDESINDDLLARIISVDMKGDITKAEATRIQLAMTDLEKRRMDVLMDIQYAIDNPSNMENVIVESQKKYPRWARLITPILKTLYPEVNHFDFDLNIEERDMSADHLYWSEFCHYLLLGTRPGEYVRFEGIKEFYSRYRQFCEYMGEGPRDIRSWQKFSKDWEAGRRGIQRAYETESKRTGNGIVYTIKVKSE